MLRSYWKTAVRFLMKNKTFSFINIFGLTMGTLCCLYILLYVTDQYSFDRQHPDLDNLYRVDVHYKVKTAGIDADFATAVAPMAPSLKKEYPEIVQYARVVPFLQVERHIVSYDKTVLYDKDACYVDSTFFDLFAFHFVEGNPTVALADPFSVVLLKSFADKLFGSMDPIGKTISIENIYNKRDYVVKGVVDESLGKSHLHADIFITMNSDGLGAALSHETAWDRNGYLPTYVRLQPGTDPRMLEKKLPAFVEKYEGARLKQQGIENRIFLQPVRSIHTTPGLKGFVMSEPVNPVFLTILLSIAGLIQLIACINFMNLSTARASRRAKEVGVRKVIGAGKSDLIRQFLGESFLISLIGVVIAIPLLLLMLPLLDRITGADIHRAALLNGRVALLLGGIVVVTGLLAGSYPAFYLSAFQAIRVMKGNFTSQMSANGIRRSLVVFQFVLAILLITGLVVIWNQLNYIRTKDLGFKKDQVLVLTLYTDEKASRVAAFMDDIRPLAGVTEVSNASKFLSSPVYFSNSFFLKGQSDAQAKNSNFIITDDHFVKANGIAIVSGREFWPTDSAKVLINETYARDLGLTPTTALGVRLYDNQNRVEEIVGVMKDFHTGSLHEKMGNMLLWTWGPHGPSWPNIIVSTNTENYRSLLQKMADIWARDIPGPPFNYTFLDDQVKKQYEADLSLSRIINSFTAMAILISCMGLFGLAAFSAEQRSKEVGIRKVLGASVQGLATLLSADFLKLVTIAFVIATPVAWWAMNRWLETFAYQISMRWWMFGIAGGVALLIALVTVSYHAIRAAVASPVRSLRAE